MRKLLQLFIGVMLAMPVLAENSANDVDPWEGWNRKVYSFRITA